MKRRNDRAFTLIELLLVIAIIVILVGILRQHAGANLV
jgi:prepilin-type N-terminal cleavage/methylation domain-containing protein